MSLRLCGDENSVNHGGTETQSDIEKPIWYSNEESHHRNFDDHSYHDLVGIDLPIGRNRVGPGDLSR